MGGAGSVPRGTAVAAHLPDVARLIASLAEEERSSPGLTQYAVAMWYMCREPQR
jgi:hypothetical protein